MTNTVAAVHFENMSVRELMLELRSKLIFLPIATFVTIGILIGVGCASLVESVVSQPKVSFYSIGVRDAKQDGATAVIALNVENPNGISLTVDRLRYDLELGGRKIAEADIEKAAIIPAHETTRVEIPVPFRYDQIFVSVFDLISNGTAAYKVKGSASIGIFTLPFDHNGELKLRQ